jgi:CRP-like cAMP-binding protein
MEAALSDRPFIEVLKTVPLLADLSDSQFQWIADHAEDLRYGAGAVLASPGDAADHLIIILEGEMQARRETGGLNGSVYIAEAGEFTGLLPHSRMTSYSRTSRSLAPAWWE